MIVATTREDPAVETRVAITPETARKFAGLGASVVVQAGAGLSSGITDADYEAAGAKVVASARDALANADIVLKVRRPSASELADTKKGAVVVAIMDPYGREQELAAMARAGVAAFSMELMPRITRAQVMDVLSSQANLAGYRAVIDAAADYGRAFPMMMTAAGTVPAARVFVMGAGVAGLQAIATARRLGAVVTATDVRPAAKEQVELLGAKFVAVEDEEFKQAETSGGYAKEMSDTYKAKQAELVATHIAKQDIVVTTALIPGRPAPRLVSAAMVASMKPGSVVIDLAVERGGNVEGAKSGETVVSAKGVKIVGHANVAGRIAASSSALYAKNLYAFVETLIDKDAKALAVKWDDELVKATLLTRDGAVVHPNFMPKMPKVADPVVPEATLGGPLPSETLTTDGGGAAAAKPKKGIVMAALSPQEALERARQAAEAARQAAEAAQGYAQQASEAMGHALSAMSGGAVDPTVFRLAIFVLAIFVGYYVVWSVTPALHTPLMSVTNAISSVIAVGALLAVGVNLAAGEGASSWARVFGFVALLLASVNIFGGFLVTERMLAMYKKKG